MTKSRVIILLKSLNKKELKGLDPYIQLSLVTKNAEVIALFKYVSAFSPNYASPELEQERVYEHLFPNSEFNSGKFRNLKLSLTKIIDNYLIFLQYQKDSFQKQKLLNQIYNKRNIGDEFQTSAKKLLKTIDKRKYQNASYFYDQYTLLRDLFFHVSTPREGKEIIDILKAALDNLYQFYSIERLRLGLDLKNREQIYKEAHQFRLIDDSANINNDDNLLFVILQAIFNLLGTGEEKEEDLFFKVKKLFIDNIDRIAPEDRLSILQYLLNYAMQQVNRQEDIYGIEVFALYKIGIESKILLPNNQISGPTFINIVVVSTNLKKFDYAKEFMESHKIYVNERIREDVETLAWSYYHFNKENYEKVAETLASFSFPNLLYMISARTLSLRTSYKLFEKQESYSKMLLADCAAFNRYLRRKTAIISPRKKEAHINFTILLKAITEQKRLLNQGQEVTVDLLDLFNKHANTAARSWLETLIKGIMSINNDKK